MFVSLRWIYQYGLLPLTAWATASLLSSFDACPCVLPNGPNPTRGSGCKILHRGSMSEISRHRILEAGSENARDTSAACTSDFRSNCWSGRNVSRIIMRMSYDSSARWLVDCGRRLRGGMNALLSVILLTEYMGGDATRWMGGRRGASWDVAALAASLLLSCVGDADKGTSVARESENDSASVLLVSV